MGKWLWLSWSVILSGLVLTSWVILGIGVDKPLFMAIAELTIVAMFGTLEVAGWTVLSAAVSALESRDWLDAIIDHAWNYRSWIVWPSVTDRWRLCATGLGGLCVGMSLLILGMWATTLLVGPGMLLATLFAAAGVIALVVLGAALFASVMISGAAVWQWLSPDGPKGAD